MTKYLLKNTIFQVWLPIQYVLYVVLVYVSRPTLLLERSCTVAKVERKFPKEL